MKLLLASKFFFLLLLCSTIHSQEYINVRKLPIPNCNGKYWREFTEGKHNILVLPDNPSEASKFYKMCSYLLKDRADSLIRKESELSAKDVEQALWINGMIEDFKDWDKFNLPFKKIKGGFSFNGKEYTNKDDGFFYISPNRIVYSGNSPEIMWKPQTTFASIYRYMIFENGLLSKLAVSDSEVIDIKKIRETNYNRKTTKYYNVYTDKHLKDIEEPDSIVYDICKKLELNPPDSKINAFIHDDPNATRLFANFFFMKGCDTLPYEDKFGTVQLDGIQITRDDFGLLKHETFHILWDSIVGRPENSNSFFLEGIQKYFEYINDTPNFTNSLKVQSKHLDYDMTELVNTGESFWRTPLEENHPIAYELSGLFVKYLIDSHGLNTYKKFCIQKDLKKAFIKYYNAEDHQVISSYKDWVRNAIHNML